MATEGDHTVLSLDLGGSLGWCFVKNGTILHYGEVSLSRTDEHPGLRYIRFNNWLQKFKGVSEIFYERVEWLQKSRDAAHRYGGYVAVLQMFCLAYGIRCCSIPTSKVKSEFCGDEPGKRNKELMCKVAHKLGWKGGERGTDLQNNACDAIAIAWCLLKRHDIEPRFPEPPAGIGHNSEGA